MKKNKPSRLRDLLILLKRDASLERMPRYKTPIKILNTCKFNKLN